MSVLLLCADDYGTLAAIRCFARNGIKVTVGHENRWGRGRFSRYADERVVHPPFNAPDALVDWLHRWGERHPGMLIYPANDSLAWLYASERERLRESFRMFSPDAAAIVTLLDKLRLREACSEVGIESPESVAIPGDVYERDAFEHIGDLRYPILLKPRTRILLQGGVKGFVVREPAQLASQLRSFRRLVSFAPAFAARHPDLAAPIAQEYRDVAETTILSLTGFVGAGGESVVLTSVKILQRPRKVGIGLCFEGRETDDTPAAKVVALCESVGYTGVFEAELILDGGRQLLIDFNPRFYSQMGFEIARGMEFPLLVWHAARGEHHPVPQASTRPGEIYCHKTLFDLVLALQRLSGRMSSAEVRRWQEWHRRAAGAGAATDAVRDRHDPLPAIVDGALWLADFVRYPRGFVNEFVLNR